MTVIQSYGVSMAKSSLYDQSCRSDHTGPEQRGLPQKSSTQWLWPKTPTQEADRDIRETCHVATTTPAPAAIAAHRVSSADGGDTCPQVVRLLFRRRGLLGL